MIFNCPICSKDQLITKQVESNVPFVQTCDFCDYRIFLYKKFTGEIIADDAEWREIALSYYIKERQIKMELEEIEDALFSSCNPYNGKYANNNERDLLKKKEELEQQYRLLFEERDTIYSKTLERRDTLSKKYNLSK
jgi:hypothetical protein